MARTNATRRTEEETQPDTQREAAQATLDDARRRWEEARAAMEGYIKEHPARAALIAAGVGAAIGAALTLALRRRR